MSRKTASDRVRVAHELRRRPEVRARFESGALSYSKVRAITRVKGADDETDRRLLEVAETGTTADLERLARHFEQLESRSAASTTTCAATNGAAYGRPGPTTA